MRSNIIMTAIVAASLAGSTMIAAAQTQPAPGASGQGEVGPNATHSKMKMKSNRMEHATTGSASHRMRNSNHAMTRPDPTGQGSAGPGTINNRPINNNMK
jgi:hypothetical protein